MIDLYVSGPGHYFESVLTIKAMFLIIIKKFY